MRPRAACLGETLHAEMLSMQLPPKLPNWVADARIVTSSAENCVLSSV
eukprot:SAG25_NODE_199_length_12089_cov_86.323853_9_plen_48_part_00